VQALLKLQPEVARSIRPVHNLAYKRLFQAKPVAELYKKYVMRDVVVLVKKIAEVAEEVHDT
jgi:hypothetical protein